MALKHLLFATLAAVTGATHADVLFVDDDSCPGPGNGSEANPYCSIQTAIDNAVDTDEIVVAPGTYFETIDFLGKAVWLHSSDGPDVTIIDAGGGFGAGSVVTCASGEGPASVLQGFTITGGAGTDSAGPLPFGGGLYNQNASPTVTDCTFTENSAFHGGGMYNVGGSPTVTDCRFASNSATFGGGGMRNDGGSPTLTDCTFAGNSAFIAGGGGMLNDGSNPTLMNCIFSGNSVSQGCSPNPPFCTPVGVAVQNLNSNPILMHCEFLDNRTFGPFDSGGSAMHNVSSSPLIVECTFARNVRGVSNASSNPTLLNCTFDQNDGTGMVNEDSNPTVTDCMFSGNGGGMRNKNSSPTVTGCTFSGNTGSGGMYNDDSDALVNGCTFIANSAGFGGGGMSNNTSSPTVVDCLFTENTTGSGGGGMRNSGSDSTITNCTFTKNSADHGGGMANNNSNPTVTSCTFSANTAGGSLGGGGMYNASSSPTVINCTLSGNTASGDGGGMNNAFSSPAIINCTFSANTADLGGGMYSWECCDRSSDPTLTSCVLWDNGANGIVDVSGAVTSVGYSNIQDGWPGTGNIDTDPLFVDPDNGDYRLQAGSPSIDAGHNNGIADLTDTDLDGNPRFADDSATDDTGCGVPVVVDMGAYEYQGVPAKVQAFADLNGDGFVGIADLMILNGCTGSDDPDCCLADLNVDGVVGMSDRMLLIPMLYQAAP